MSGNIRFDWSKDKNPNLYYGLSFFWLDNCLDLVITLVRGVSTNLFVCLISYNLKDKEG